MDMILLVLFFIFTPLLILYLTHRYKFAQQLGAVIIAYGFGLILGNIGILPPKSALLTELMLTQPDITGAEIIAMAERNALAATDVFAF